MILELKEITKTYSNGETVTALRGLSIGFRGSEFVAVFGPSGCGKTTLLNIIGGLDRYDSGDLVINGLSTKKFRDSDWDAYRNRSVGFVFQSYNLIGHQSVLQNVEIAMALSGVSASERKRRAVRALEDVGLSDQLRKKPNQLSGGQMQRVAIARALVNDPDIILADEPTGALDSHTSVQIMEILKEISHTRLVIMVTHNMDLADRYSTRIVRLLDGEILSDSDPVPSASDGAVPAPSLSGRTASARAYRKTSMSIVSAIRLSFRNLMTKRGRTIITSIAGSIGIIGVALVLALSTGLSAYIAGMQSDTLSGFPISIDSTAQTVDLASRRGLSGSGSSFPEYPDTDVLYSYNARENSTRHVNIITQDYLDYVEGLKTAMPDAINNISYAHGVSINLLAGGGSAAVRFPVSSGASRPAAELAGIGGYWEELPESNDFILSLYDLIGEGSRMPAAMNEVVLVVDKYNRIDRSFFEDLGITDQADDYPLAGFIGQTILKVIPNDSYYTQSGDLFSAAAPSDYERLYGDGTPGIRLTIVGILRPKEDASGSYLSPGLAYTPALTAAVLEDARGSTIAAAQSASDTDVLLGTPFADAKAKEDALLALGADTAPTGIRIYPRDYASKDRIKDYLDRYNEGRAEADQLVYTDMAETITSITRTLLDTVTYVLIGFAAVSLLVSTIMISIITYVSVIERTREIGILRSVGARKKDISRVFNAETLIIGFTAGTIGVAVSYLLTMPINLVIHRFTGLTGIAELAPAHAAALIAGSMVLTLIAGFIPSRMAAAKDPVIALRTE